MAKDPDRATQVVVVHVLLERQVPERELFLLRRAGTGFLDGHFALPGGHVRTGELPAAAAARECFEETGVRAELQPLCVMPYLADGVTGINFVFTAHAFAGVATIGEPHRADLAVWARPGALPGPRPRWVDAAAAQPAGDGAWYREFTYP